MMDEPAVKEKNWGLRVMAVAAAGLLLSLGMCAVGSSTGNAEEFFVVSGVVILVLSILGMFVGVVMALISGIARQ